MTDKRAQRKASFEKIGKAISNPTLFNPHYSIKGRVIQDRSVSCRIGPQMKSLQWEPTGWKR